MLRWLSLFFSLVIFSCSHLPSNRSVEESYAHPVSLPILKINRLADPINDQAAASIKPATGGQVEASDMSDSRPQNRFETHLNLWELLSDRDGIKTYREIHPTGEIVSFRGEAVLHTSIERIAAVLNTPELSKDWIDSLADTHIVEKRSLFDRTEYVRTRVPWPFEDRDFVFRVQVQVGQSPHWIMIKMNSVEDPREPPHPGVVRGTLLHAYYFLADVSNSESPATKVIVEIAADPRGSIPTWIVNLTQKTWPNQTLRALEKVSGREDLFVKPEINLLFRTRAGLP